jgi:hypothetical protein
MTVHAEHISPRELSCKQAAVIAGIGVATFRKAQREGKYPGATLPGQRIDARLLEKAMDALSGITTGEGTSPLDRWRASRGASEA